MASFVEIGLSNAIAATFLAAIVAILCRWIRRPAVRHALWLLVLIKLVTPPLWTVPTGIRLGLLQATSPPAQSQVVTAAPRPVPQSPVIDAVKSRTDSTAPARATLPPMTAVAKPAATGAFLPSPIAILIGVWLAGAGLLAIRQLVILGRFACGLRWVHSDRLLQSQADALAANLGMRRAPRVLLIPGCTSPMLFAAGPCVRLLFPAELLGRLDADARGTLLAHELAHYRRGDHWVRLLELVVGCLFWWHPVVWWARRQIEMAEEECCDAWVVSQFPETPRRYAEALLETIDFLHETPVRVPALASGLGDVPFLKRRLTLIMRGPMGAGMSRTMRCAVLVVAVVCLPWRPSLTGAATAEVIKRARLLQTSRQPGPRLRPVASNRVAAPARPTQSVAPEPNTADAASVATGAPATVAIETTTVEAAAPSGVASESIGEMERVSAIWASVTSPDGRFTVTKDDHSQVRLRDEVTGRSTDLTQGGDIASVAFRPGTTLFVTGGPHRLRLWNAETGQVVKELDESAGGVQSVAFTPDGRYVVAGSEDGRVRVWNSETALIEGQLAGHVTAVNCLNISPDGRTLAVATGNGNWKATAAEGRSAGRVTLWSLPDLTLKLTLESAEPVGAVAFRESGTIVAGGGWDGQVILWDTRTGELHGTGTVSKDLISIAAFSGDSRALSEAVISPPSEVMPVDRLGESLTVPWVNWSLAPEDAR